MSEQHWKTDRPETPEQALELLRFGAVFTEPGTAEVNRVRTERRMDRCAQLFERELARQEYHIASLQAHIQQLKEEARLASWTTSPDRMGGQFTPDEINGRETW